MAAKPDPIGEVEVVPEVPEASILLIGDSGTGKTKFLGGIPDVFIFDFDKGLATLRDAMPEHKLVKDAPRGGKAMPERDIYPWGTGWEVFLKELNRIGDLIEKGQGPRSIAFDSLTTMGNLALNYVMKQNNHHGPPHIQHWGTQMALLETALDQFTAWPGLKVVTAHVQRNTNDLTQVIEMLPLVTGKLAGKTSVYFDEVYFTVVKGRGSEKRYVLQTESDAMMKQAKTRFGVPDGTLSDWAKVAPYLAT